ncbi:PAS domain S-box protein, partial [Microvirga calopogonii]|uniref:PAS domain S-box protein n=1 Tax=Microvirga calopogonii TaxID=2078013 RepID=UPI000E0CC6A7
MESTVEPLPNGGIMGARVRHHDWTSTSLGPIATWPQSLKSLVNLVLAAPLPMNLLWGPELIQIYNDAYAPLMGLKHPAGLGQPAAECWHEVWEVAGPLYERVFAGETVVLENSQWILNRQGVPEAAWFDNYLIPVLDEKGAVGGALVIAFETTGRVKAAVERDQSEQALRASEQRLQRVIETDAVGMIFFDHSGTLVDANDVFLNMTGYTRAEVGRRELTWRRLTPAEWVGISEEQLQKLAATGRIGPYEKEYILKDGSRRWMLFAGRDLGDGTTAEYCLDITARKQAETALQASETRLQAAVDLVGLSPYTWDPATGALGWDARLKAMWGLPPDASVDHEVWLSGIHPEDRAQVDAALAHCVDPTGDGVYHIDYRVIGIDDGVERWVSTQGRTTFENGQPVGFTGVALEITERKRAEAALRESEERFRQFAENSNSTLWILDLATMNLEYLSPAFEAIWGETIATTLGDPSRWSRFLHPDDRQRVFDALDRVRLGEAFTEEFRIVRSDGVVRWIRDTFFPMRDAQGRIRRAGGVAQDITRHDGRFVYVVDADEPSRQDLTRGLRDAGYDVRAFPSGKAFLEAAPALAAGCVVLDMRQPEAGGLTIPRELKARRIGLPVIVLGALQSDVKSAVQVMKTGAVDFLPVPYAPDELLTALASAAADISQADEHDQEANRARGLIAEMPVREREVLEGLLAGQTNKQIGRAIGLSPRTVETHRAHVMQRLGARTIPEL